MARVRLIGPEPVTVPELGGRTVQTDEVVEVPDGRFDAYVCQPTTWESVEEPEDWTPPETEAEEHEPELPARAAAKKTAPKKTAAAPQKQEG
ncbi:hypothetical protein [Streptomyces sp. NPDC096153]|uniref:hypothetical protein n=1 Tax=Streptomyces sp. NPDC096153 TaxID=3155548 RepID=UPI00332E3B4A